MTARDRTGRFTAERTTTTVTERITIETTRAAPAITFAPGWVSVLPDEVDVAQRDQQVDRALHLLVLEAHEDGEPSRALIEAAATVLRAGPGASPKELVLGGRAL